MNLCDTWLEQFYGKIPFENYTLLDRSVRTLEENSGGRGMFDSNPWSPRRGIKPSNEHYFAGLWNWDCAFHAMAAARWDAELARDQVRIFLELQRDNGQFPDVWFCNGEKVWGCAKPPIFPWAAWEIEKRSHDDAFVAAACAGFERNEQFYLAERGGAEHGLFFYDGSSDDPQQRLDFARCDSGWDNSPRWDRGVNHLFAIDLNCYMVLFYRAMERLASRSAHPEKAPEWKSKASAMCEKIEQTFWNPELSCYTDYDYVAQKHSTVITPASFMPLFIGSASAERAQKMADVARKHFHPGWPSVSYRSSAFDPTGYWRGRMWLNIAYFALKGLKNYGCNDLANSGRDTLLEMLRRSPGSLYENYHPQNGLPIGVPSFGWTAVFAIKFLLDWDTEDL